MAIRAKKRKVRNLVNGKMYTTKNQAASAELRSRKAIARLDPEAMMRATRANMRPEAIAKRVKGYRRFRDRNPGFDSAKSKKMYRDNPGLREVRSKDLVRTQECMGLSTTDPETAELISFKLQCFKDGKQVIEYVDCEREKTVGVVYKEMGE